MESRLCFFDHKIGNMNATLIAENISVYISLKVYLKRI